MKKVCGNFFFPEIRSTQRCESMNSYLNWFLKIHLRLYEFVKQFDKAITKISHNEDKVKFETNNSSPVLSIKRTIFENHAASVFTKESFLKFHKEMKNTKLFFAIEVINNDTFWSYILSKFKHPNSKCEVQFWLEIVTLKWFCMMFESIDIPCSHMIVVMKVEHLKEVPSSCTLKR